MLFDNYTLEELEQFRENPQKMNKEQLSKLQEILGINADGVFGPQTAKALQEKLGVKVDGKWGPKSIAAYVDAYNQSFGDEAQYQKAISQGKTNPLVQDFTDFYNNGYEQSLIQEKGRHEKIAKLEAQIAQVEERIASNKRALYGKSYEDVNNKLAQMELDKIGFRFNGQPTNTDPTSFWRWNQARVDTNKANDLINVEAKNKFANTVDMWVNTKAAPTTEGIMQQISNINSAIRDGKNIGADVSRLQTKKEELENLVYGGYNTGSQANYGVGTEYEQKASELETVLATAKTSDELINFRNGYKWKPEQLTKLDTKIAELKKKEDAKDKAILEKKAKELFQKERPSEDWEEVSEATRKKYRNLARGK